jgi:hypothetical protein
LSTSASHASIFLAMIIYPFYTYRHRTWQSSYLLSYL